MTFQKIERNELDMNIFKSIGTDWMLISAGDEKQCNTMTASWGSMGVLWGENIITAYIRPQRYTKEFIDSHDCFSLSFFDGRKKELAVLGSVSGRDEDKIKNVGFHPMFIEGIPTFEEAKLVFIVKKIYTDTIKPECFLDTSLNEKWYPQKDHHIAYTAKIQTIYKKID